MRKIKYILIILIGFFILSCNEDFVNLNNPNQNTTGSFWKTKDDAIKGINSVYEILHHDGLYMRLYNWVMDVRADDMRNSSPWWINDVSLYAFSPDNPCYIAPWEHNYTGIWRANQVLENVEGIEMDQDLKDRIKGEAHFLRGLFYYHLVIVYKNVPLITVTPKSSDEYYPAQSSDTEVWNQIISDFTTAKDLLWLKSATSDKGRATKGSAAAYLAKSLMFVKRFNEAAPILKDIIDGVYDTYSLVDNYQDNFLEANENNSESLFEVQFERSVGGTRLNWNDANDPLPTWSKTSGKARTYAPVPFGYGDVAPTIWICNEFQLEKTIDGKNDPRLETSLIFNHPGDTTYLLYNKRMPMSYLSNAKALADANGFYVKKYLNCDDGKYSDELEWRSGINERIMRYADVLLLYAECLNEAGQTNDSYAYIQQVRTRADLPDLATTKPGMNQEQMRDQIAHERALEFCFEAQRYVDILRWGWFNDPAKLATLKQHDPEVEKWTTGREIMAIPPNELDVNKNLVQNPGWN